MIGPHPLHVEVVKPPPVPVLNLPTSFPAESRVRSGVDTDAPEPGWRVRSYDGALGTVVQVLRRGKHVFVRFAGQEYLVGYMRRWLAQERAEVWVRADRPNTRPDGTPNVEDFIEFIEE